MESTIERDELIEIQKIVNDNNNKSVVVLDGWNKIVFVNKVFESYTGYALDEIKGSNPLTIGIGDNTPEEFLEMMDSVTKGNSYSCVFKNIKKSGEIYFYPDADLSNF